MKSEYDVKCVSTGKTTHFREFAEVETYIRDNATQEMHITPVEPTEGFIFKIEGKTTRHVFYWTGEPPSPCWETTFLVLGY